MVLLVDFVLWVLDITAELFGERIQRWVRKKREKARAESDGRIYS